MKESMITVRLQYYINSVSGGWGDRRQRVFFFSSTLFPAHTFLILIFTNCMLHPRMLTDANLWRVRCYTIYFGITHKVKKTRDPK